MRNKNRAYQKIEAISAELDGLEYAQDAESRTEIWITVESLAMDLLQAVRPFKKGK